MESIILNCSTRRKPPYFWNLHLWSSVWSIWTSIISTFKLRIILCIQRSFSIIHLITILIHWILLRRSTTILIILIWGRSLRLRTCLWSICICERTITINSTILHLGWIISRLYCCYILCLESIISVISILTASIPTTITSSHSV